MATNKRKEAAALFELIDKSTLKVPKDARGALKIPSWWSSKTNPSSGPIPAPGRSGSHLPGSSIEELPAHDPADAPRESGAATSALPAPVNSAPPSASSAPAAATSDSPMQARLFQPPPQEVTGRPSPSIRPPARTPILNSSAPATPAPLAAAPAPAAPAPEAHQMEPLAEEEGEDRPVESTAPVPPSAAPLRKWEPPAFGGMFANVPPQARIAAGIGAGVILLLILYFLFRPHHAPTVAPNSTDIQTPIIGPSQDNPPDNRSALQTNSNGNTQQTPPHGLLGDTPTLPGNTDNTPTNTGNKTAPTAGVQTLANGSKIYDPHTFPFSPDLVYVVIVSYTGESMARQNAKFIADHGVDVAIERAHGFWYLIATKGFANNAAAEPWRKKIVEIGKLHPSFKTTHKTWTDAAPNKITIGASGN